MRPSLFVWFVVFFVFVMFMLIAPLPLWFRIAGVAFAVAAYWRYRWINDLRDRMREAIRLGQERYEERKRRR